MASDVIDDFFGEDADADEIAAEIQIKRITENRTKDGIRDGITDGQNVTLQSGFNVGYERGFSTIEPLATIRGCLWSILNGLSMDAEYSSDSYRPEVEATIAQLQELERKTRDSLKRHSVSQVPTSQTEFVHQNLKDCASALEEKCRTVLRRLDAPEDYFHTLFQLYKVGCS